MKFIFSKQTYEEKPQNAAPLQQPQNYHFADLDIKGIAERIAQGRAWRAAVYDDNTPSFRKANARGAFILALDFDACEYKPQEVCEYAISLGIQPSIWYYSYSQGKKTGYNFRVLWVLAEMISPNQYENIYKNLLEKFSMFSPDVATKDCSRLWYGTNSSISIINHTPIQLSVIGFLGVATKIEAKKQLQTIKIAVKNCEKEYFEAAQEEIEPFYITVQDGFKWYDILGTEKCWLWKQWKNGEYLNYNQRLVLFTNLKYLKYNNHAYSVIQDVLSFYNENTYKGHTCNEAQIRTMFSQTSLYPIGIVKVEGQENLITIKEYFENYAKKEVKNTIEKITLEELDKRLDDEFPRLLASDGITYIKAQPASGKTHRVINYLLDNIDLSEKKVIYAVPTYNNIDEFQKRFLEADAARRGFSMASFITCIPRGNYSARDLLLLELGLKAETKQETRLYYIQQMLDYNKKGLFVATHQLISHLKGCRADLIIIDENVEDCLRFEVIMDSTEIAGLRPHSDAALRNEITKLSDELPSKDYGDIDISIIRKAIKSNNFNWESYTNSNNIIKGIGMLRGEMEQPRVVKRNNQSVIRVITRSTLIADALEYKTPVKLLSATPLNEMLKALYNTDNIDVYEFPIAENKGKIIQYEKETGAKTDGDGRLKVAPLIKYIKEKLTEKQIKESYVLTFEAFINDFRKAGFNIPRYNLDDLHIANNAGLDVLKGKNIIIAAKFDMNDEYYKNLYLDIHGSLENKSFSRQWVIEKINGREKRLYLLEDEDLRKLQIEQIHRYLEQAAGRARALRERGVKVYLFTDFPLADADEYIY